MAAHFPQTSRSFPLPGTWFSNDRIVHRPNGAQRSHYDRCGAAISRRDAKLLIAYDWAESFVGLNLVLKPLVDELFMKYLSDLALRQDDYLLGQIFYSLNEDCQWHRQWSECLVRMAIEDNVRNRDTIQGWISQWYPLAARAVHTLAPLLEDILEQTKAPPLERTEHGIDRYYHDYLRSMNLGVGS
jgi:hypothetical protein